MDIIVSELEKLNELGEMRGWLNSYYTHRKSVLQKGGLKIFSMVIISKKCYAFDYIHHIPILSKYYSLSTVKYVTTIK